MKNQVNESAKIEQLLGELGRISPPFLNNREQLKRIASELYLLADLLADKEATETAPVSEAETDTSTLNIPNLQPNHTDWSNPVPDFIPEQDEEQQVPIKWMQPESAAENLMEHPAEPVLPPAPQVQIPEIKAAPPAEILPEHPAEPVLPPAPQVHTPEIKAAPPTEILPEHPAERVLPPAPQVHTPEIKAAPMPNPVAPQSPSRDLHKSLPLVKRIEFINRLFAGKDDEWQRFCRQVNQASHAEAALGIYRESFIRMGWEKNADSADQLKQVIVKICA
jgi:hypothetical protein